MTQTRQQPEGSAAARLLAAATSPRWLARMVALLGLISLVSALSPSIGSRVDLIREIMPAFAPAAARAGAAATGLVLLFLARGLRRRKHRAWVVAVLLSVLAAALHMTKGLDVEEAVLAATVGVLLVLGRRSFTARPDPRSTRTVAVTAIGAYALATALGWTLLVLTRRHEVAGTTGLERLRHTMLGLFGVPGPVQFTTGEASARATAALLVLGVTVLFTVLGTLLRPAGGPHTLTDAEESGLRALLARHGSVDSLSYFTLRRDRSVIFSASGKAAVSYRVVGGVSLAGGDPVGDPEAWPQAIAAWLEEADGYGWRPGVLGAGEPGALAYRRAGLDALELGDEAILEVEDFGLQGRRMRPVRQAVSRVTRAGYEVRIDRLRDLDPAASAEIERAADAWRDGPTERGFSMALGRFGDPQDQDCFVVRAIDTEGDLRGLMHLVPWGADGISLDLMRRDREAENGTIEAMVAALVAAAPGIGVRRISLNFAVFRAVFERGERLGAGPVLRLWRAVLLQASRFWQIEALYRANAKYHPLWVPRYVCFREARDLPTIGVAALRAEAFLQRPAWARLPRRSSDGRRHPGGAVAQPDEGTQGQQLGGAGGREVGEHV